MKEWNKNMAKLITDTTDHFECELIQESIGNSKIPTYKIKGIYAQADVKNGNNRIYPYEDLKKEMDRFNKEMVEPGRALGNLEHPNHAEIKPEEAAVRILSLKEDNKSWIGESCILASCPEKGIKGTPQGDILLGIVQYGTKVGFSTRSLGTVNESTGEVSDLHLCTIDCVTNPSIGCFCSSNADRFVNGILESKSFVINTHGDILEEKYNDFEKTLSKLPNTYINSNKAEFLGKAITEFFNSITK